MERTPFAGLTRLDPTDPLSTDDYSFQARNPAVIDYLLKLAVQTHRHDGHAALANPLLDPTVATLDTGGTIPADTAITVGYTLIDADGGETVLNATPQIVTTQAGLLEPDDSPTLVADVAAGSLVAGSYAYAITVTDGAGGETVLGPTASVIIPSGSATNEVVISGLSAIVAAAGGSGWRLWRSVNGGEWAMLNDGATDTITDDGSLCADCSVSPPSVGSGTTNATARLQVTVPGGQPDEAVQFRIYASTDGTFSSPALLGTYPIADAGTVKTYDSLALLDGAPPPVSLSMPGATNIFWKDPVATAADLPTTASEGDVRISLDDMAIHGWTGSAWVSLVGSGGGGGGGAPGYSQLVIPFSFADADILTGKTLYTPTPGDVMVYGSCISIDTAFNGTTPWIGLYIDTVGTPVTNDVLGADATAVDSSNGNGTGSPNTTLTDSVFFDSVHPLKLKLTDSTDTGDPGSTVGHGEVRLIIVPHDPPAGGGGGGGAPVVEYISVPFAFDTAGLASGDGIPVYDPAPGDILLALAISIQTGFDGASPGLYVYPNNAIGAMTWANVQGQEITGGDVTTPDDTSGYVGFSYPSNYWTPGVPNAFDGTPIFARLGNYSSGGADPGSTVGAGEIQMVVAKHP